MSFCVRINQHLPCFHWKLLFVVHFKKNERIKTHGNCSNSSAVFPRKAYLYEYNSRKVNIPKKKVCTNEERKRMKKEKLSKSSAKPTKLTTLYTQSYFFLVHTMQWLSDFVESTAICVFLFNLTEKKRANEQEKLHTFSIS